MWTKVFVAACALWACVGVATGQRATRLWKSQAEEVREMAGPHTWVSTTGDWGAASSWDTGLVPAATEDVVFNGNSSDVDVTAGLTTGVTLGQLWVKDNYSGNLGTHATNALSVGAAQFIYRGFGAAYISGTLTECLIESANLVDAFTHVSGGTTRSYFLSGGIVSTSGEGAIAAAYVLGKDVTWTVEAGSTLLRNVWMRSGTVVSGKGFAGATSLEMSGGSWQQNGSGQIVLLAMHGGFLEHNSVDAGVGIGSLYAIGGVVDFTQDARAKDVPILIIGPYADVRLTPSITHTSVFADLRQAVPTLP